MCYRQPATVVEAWVQGYYWCTTDSLPLWWRPGYKATTGVLPTACHCGGGLGTRLLLVYYRQPATVVEAWVQGYCWYTTDSLPLWWRPGYKATTDTKQTLGRILGTIKSYIPKTEQHEPKEQILFHLENGIYLLDVTPSNPLPHPLSPPSIPLCVIKFKDLVAKQHPTRQQKVRQVLQELALLLHYLAIMYTLQ